MFEKFKNIQTYSQNFVTKLKLSSFLGKSSSNFINQYCNASTVQSVLCVELFRKVHNELSSLLNVEAFPFRS